MRVLDIDRLRSTVTRHCPHNSSEPSSQSHESRLKRHDSRHRGPYRTVDDTVQPSRDVKCYHERATRRVTTEVPDLGG